MRSPLLCLVFLTLTACGVTGEVGSDEEDERVAQSKGFRAEYSLADLHPIARYAQDDPAWGGRRLFDGSHCSDTLAASGCAVTAHAMLASYYDGEDNPAQHNTCLEKAGAHSGCNIDWDGCLPEGVTHVAEGSGLLATLRRELDAGYPVIAHVRRAGRSSCHHFVLVTGYTKPGTKRSQFEIFDPATGDTDALSAYAAVCSTEQFRGSANLGGNLVWQTPTGPCTQSDCLLSVKAGGAVDAVVFETVLAGDDGTEVSWPLGDDVSVEGRTFQLPISFPPCDLRIRVTGYNPAGAALVRIDRNLLITE